MKLISEADFNRLSQHSNSDTSSEKESGFDQNFKKSNILLNTQTIPDDIKLAMYSSLMNSISDHLRKILETPILVKNVGEDQGELKNISADTSATEIDDEFSRELASSSSNTSSSNIHLNQLDNHLLLKLPEKCRRKAGDIMLSLKEHPELIRWNKIGEVAFFDQEFDAGSSIVDLLSYVVHDLKWSIAPKATNRFLLCMKTLNIPLSLMRADVRKMLSKDIEHISDIKSASNSPSYFVQMKSRLKDWISIKDEEKCDFSPVRTSTPKK